jgi:hypothetical protein
MRFIDLIEELEQLADNGFYTRDKISWWLIKYEERYIGLGKIKDTLKTEFPKANLRTHKNFIKELLFIELYEDLEKINDESKSNLDNKKININEVINKIKTSTNGLNRKDKNFKWDSKHRR